jgi:nitrate reductase gamma subunit
VLQARRNRAIWFDCAQAWKTKPLSDTTAISGEKGSVMKAQGQNARLIRRVNRKKIRTKIGPRVFILFIIATIITGTLAISMNTKLEDWERTHHTEHDDR